MQRTPPSATASWMRTASYSVRRRIPLALTAVAVVVAAVAGMARFADASLVDSAPRRLSVQALATDAEARPFDADRTGAP